MTAFINKKICFLLLLPVCDFCQNDNASKTTSLKKEGLYGSVKQIKETWFNALEEDGKFVADKEKPMGGERTIKFGKKGNYIETSRYDYSALRSTKLIQLYNSKGKQSNVKNYTNDTLLFETLYKYDALGNLIETYGYKGDGSLISKSKIKYDAKGNQIESSTFNAETNSLDENGKQIKIYNTDTNRVSRMVNKYDEKGVQTEQSIYSQGDSLLMSYKWVYGNYERGTYLRTFHYSHFDKHNSSTTIDSTLYDKKGSVLKNFYYSNEKGTIILIRLDSSIYNKGKIIEMNNITYCCTKSKIGLNKTKYTYFKDSTEEIYFKKGELYYKQITKKDKKGKILEISRFNKKGDLNSKTAWKYDKYGNIIEIISWNEQTKNMKEISGSNKFLYEYDKKGNWIKKTQFYLPTIKGVVYTREIEYY